MRVLWIAVACGLLSTTASVSAQELDPINNFCLRFDHQCKRVLTINVATASKELTFHSGRQE